MAESAHGRDHPAPTLITPALLRSWPLPAPSGNKYGRGTALVVGGSRDTPGGVMLAGWSALRVGAGRLSVAVGEGIAPQLAVAMPESGTVALAENADGEISGAGADDALQREGSRADAVLVGPGLAVGEGTAEVVRAAIESVGDDTVAVLDAFGLTTFPDLPDSCTGRLAGRLVLTPNPGELARVSGADDLDDDQVPGAALALAQRFSAVVSCAGWIAHEGRLWQVSTGDTGLGTSGSGDVLGGAILGLLCRGADPVQAAVWGTYVHAAAGDVLAARVGRVGYLAGELVRELPSVLVSLGGA